MLLARAMGATSIAVLLAACDLYSNAVVRMPPHHAETGVSALSRIPRTRVTIAKVTDARPPSESVGRRESLGMPLGNVLFDPSPMQVMRDVIASELSAAGHEVVRSGAPVQLDVQVLVFTSGTASTLLYWTVTGRARIAVGVLRAGETTPLARFEYGAERSERTYLTGPTANMIRGLLEACVADIAGQIRDDARLASALSPSEALSR